MHENAILSMGRNKRVPYLRVPYLRGFLSKGFLSECLPPDDDNTSIRMRLTLELDAVEGGSPVAVLVVAGLVVLHL